MQRSPAGSALRMAVVAVVVVVVQVGLISQVRVWGVGAELPVVLAVGAGLAGGPDRGAIAGFGIGLFHDVFLSTPLGLSALAYASAAYLVGLARPALAGSVRPIAAVAVLFGTVVGVALFFTVGLLFGQSQLLDIPLAAFALVVALFAVIMAVPVTRVSEWAMGSEPDPIG